MAGSTANAALWQNADVYLNDTVAATGPTDVTTAWPAGWNAVGLLDGEEGFTENRENESSEFYAWGGILVRKTKSKYKRTIKFTVLEENATTFKLINPGSTRGTPGAGNLRTDTIKVPTNVEFAIGFEMKDGNKVKRRICKRATVDEIGEIKESEEEILAYEITVLIYPEADGTLYTEISDNDITA